MLHIDYHIFSVVFCNFLRNPTQVKEPSCSLYTPSLPNFNLRFISLRRGGGWSSLTRRAERGRRAIIRPPLSPHDIYAKNSQQQQQQRRTILCFSNPETLKVNIIWIFILPFSRNECQQFGSFFRSLKLLPALLCAISIERQHSSQQNRTTLLHWLSSLSPSRRHFAFLALLPLSAIKLTSQFDRCRLVLKATPPLFWKHSITTACYVNTIPTCKYQRSTTATRKKRPKLANHSWISPLQTSSSSSFQDFSQKSNLLMGHHSGRLLGRRH